MRSRGGDGSSPARKEPVRIKESGDEPSPPRYIFHTGNLLIMLFLLDNPGDLVSLLFVRIPHSAFQALHSALNSVSVQKLFAVNQRPRNIHPLVTTLGALTKVSFPDLAL